MFTLSSVRRFFLLLALILFATSITDAQEINPRFGVIESYESADAATRLGVGWTRVRFPWAEVQPNGADEWIPKVADEMIAAEIAAGREVVGLLIGIPQWARDSADLPQNLYLPHTDPENLWANYVREAITRYPDITHWVIWNEPDIWDENAIGYTWHGDEADFAQLMKVGYLTAKEVNPEITIHLSAMTFFWDNNFGRIQYLDRLLAEIANDPAASANNFYFDVATAHLYFQPNQILSIMGIWQEILEKYGLGDKPWWLMETNAPVTDDLTWAVDDPMFAVSQMDQANYMGQAVAVALTMGVERVAIFKLIDTESDRAANPEPFGLVRADGVERAGFWAYRTVIDLFDDIEGAERLRWDRVGHVRLTHSNGTTDVLFARRRVGETVEIECGAFCDSAELRDAFGNILLVEPIDGFINVELPPSPCTHKIGDDGCMIGGNTYYLVQREPIVPPPSPTITPSETPVVLSTATMQPTRIPQATLTATIPLQLAQIPTLELATPPASRALSNSADYQAETNFDNSALVLGVGVLVTLIVGFILMRNYVESAE